jgi:hypothetical protein
MAVTTFHDFPLAPRDRARDGAAAEKRVRAWADAEDKPNGKYRDAHIWYDAGSKQDFTGYKLLFTDIVNGRHVAVPRAIMAAGNIMQGSRGGVDLPESDITRVRNHLAKYTPGLPCSGCCRTPRNCCDAGAPTPNSAPYPNRQNQPPTPCGPQARNTRAVPGMAGRQKRRPAGTSPCPESLMTTIEGTCG